MRRTTALLAAVALLLVGTAGAAVARPFPDVIDLPPGFQPEGIAAGRGSTFYVGSLADGAVYRGDLRTGRGDVLVPGEPGRVTVGIEVDRRGRVFAAGGPTGAAAVYDGRTGETLAEYRLATGETFVNDVVVTRDAAWFTDSVNPVLYRVPIGRGGDLGRPQTVPLSGDIVYGEGFNANGIEAGPGGRTLVIVQSSTGLLFTVDAATGRTRTIDTGDQTFANGDGLLRVGRTLYVVRNQDQLIVAVRLSGGYERGQVVGQVTSEDFDVPTTIARFGRSLYAVNARFGTPPTPDTAYTVVRVDRP